MYFQKTLLATALMVAFSSSVIAADWVDVPSTVTTEELKAGQANHIDQAKFNGDFSAVGQAGKTDNSSAFASTYKLSEIELSQGSRLWVTAEAETKVIGLVATGSEKTATNNGSIYVSTENPSDSWRVKAMTSDGGAIVNNGQIIVKNGYAMQAGNTKGGSVINNKGITVLNSGVALDLSSSAAITTAKNNGDITLIGDEGSSLIGVLLGNTTFENTNNIFADGHTAVVATAGTGTLKLSGNSHIEGDVILSAEGSTLQVDNLNAKEEIDLIGGAKEVSITSSDFTINQKKGALSIGTLSTPGGSAHFNLSEVGETPVLTIVNLSEGAVVDYGYTAAVSDAFQKGEYEAQDLLDNIRVEGQSAERASLEQGLMGDEGYVDKNGFHVTRTNDVLRSAQDLAITNALMWRSQLTNLTDRMGTLRTTPDAAGVWARYNNGRLDGQGIQHDYNTVELGVDKRIADNVTIGFSFDYTKGDTDLSAGSSDNNTYTVGFYGSYFNESGCFLDTMLKIGRIDADYDFRTSAGKESADYMLTAAIFGIETGHRWNIQNYFIEPQVQLTYSHLRAENYTSSIGRDVKFDDMSSLIGRIGVMGGMQFAENRGSAYVKASYNHDFLGDVEGNYEFNGSVRQFDDELDDNWGEVSLGASYQVTDSVNTFVDVGTGFGGDIDQKWRVNLGARYVF